jgi:hypothetical protein
MGYPSIYDPSTTDTLIHRINSLQPGQQRLWGKMNVAQMLAHCCIPYEHLSGEKPYDVPFWMKWMVRLFFKRSMTNDVDYQKNGPTAPSFIVADEKDFLAERDRLMNYIRKFHGLAPQKMEAIQHGSLGKLKAAEWSNLLYKHLDHHLRQFGA